MLVRKYANFDLAHWRFVRTCECEECGGEGVVGDPDYSDLACGVCDGDGQVWELAEAERELTEVVQPLVKLKGFVAGFAEYLPDMERDLYAVIDECDDPQLLTRLHTLLKAIQQVIEEKQAELDDPDDDNDPDVCPECKGATVSGTDGDPDSGLPGIWTDQTCVVCDGTGLKPHWWHDDEPDPSEAATDCHVAQVERGEFLPLN